MTGRTRVRRHVTAAEQTRHDAVMAEVAELVRKLDEHERAGWERVSLGALHALRDAYRATGGVA